MELADHTAKEKGTVFCKHVPSSLCVRMFVPEQTKTLYDENECCIYMGYCYCSKDHPCVFDWYVYIYDLNFRQVKNLSDQQCDCKNQSEYENSVDPYCGGLDTFHCWGLAHGDIPLKNYHCCLR